MRGPRALKTSRLVAAVLVGLMAVSVATSGRAQTTPADAKAAAAQAQENLAYAIGVADPVSIFVETFGTCKVNPDILEDLIRSHFLLKPAGIIKSLDLKKPRYRKTAAYGHFGRTEKEFTWEKTDKAKALKKDAGL